MGAQWKHSGKMDAAKAKGVLFGKLSKEISVSAKLGDPNPEHNARLRAAVEAAKKASMPRDTLERAIKKGAGLLDDQAAYESIFYEGFTPHKIPVIVECLTDNKNRTAGDVRVLFRKGQLGSIGSVGWMFDRVGMIDATTSKADVDIESAAIEAGAQDVESMTGDDVSQGQSGATFFTEPSDLDAVNKALTASGWLITKSELAYRAKDYPELTAEQRKEVSEFLSDIDDNDDVHRVYAGIR